MGGAIDFVLEIYIYRAVFLIRKKIAPPIFFSSSFPEVELRPDQPGLRRFRQFVGILATFLCVLCNFLAFHELSFHEVTFHEIGVPRD
jgi:hypothetical protein